MENSRRNQIVLEICTEPDPLEIVNYIRRAVLRLEDLDCTVCSGWGVDCDDRACPLCKGTGAKK